MEKNKTNSAVKVVTLGLLTLSICFLIFTFYRVGVTVDTYGMLYMQDAWSMYSLWFSLAVAVAMLYIMHVLYKNASAGGSVNKKRVWLFLHVICALALIFTIYIIIDANHTVDMTVQVNQEPVTLVARERAFVQIPLEKLDDLISSKDSEIVYITRQNCPACIALDPALGDLLLNENMRLLLYDTIDDRENQREYLLSVLDNYGVSTVPTIVVLENGEVVTLFDGDTILEDFTTYLHAGKADEYR